MQLFFDFYRSYEPPRSNQALQSIVQLSSVRRSLFSSEKERTEFLQVLMDGIRGIMSTQVRKHFYSNTFSISVFGIINLPDIPLVKQMGLAHDENYHEFCRLLGRLKASYQLSELIKVSRFTEWLELAAQFTIESLGYWQYYMNSIHYLLALWGRMVAALPYLRNDTDSQRESTILRQKVLQVL